jgi:hypothetical protein
VVDGAAAHRHGDRGRVLGGDRFEHGSRGAAQTPTGGFVGLCADDGFGDDRRATSATTDSARRARRARTRRAPRAAPPRRRRRKRRENVVRGSGPAAAWAARRRYSARVSAPGPVGVAADSVRRLARREGVASAAGCRGQITQALVRPRGRGSARRRTTGFGSLRRSGRQR